jgi:hypothetical protein
MDHPTNRGRNRWDVFVSHASEDKEEVARPLAAMLGHKNISVWLDENVLVPGDSLYDKIRQGLAESSYGVIILSRSFFAKDWPQRELRALSSRQTDREKVIIPVWHVIDRDFITKRDPMLADLYALRTEDGLHRVADEIVRIVHPPVPVDPESFWEQRKLAESYIDGLRLVDWTGHAFQVSIGRKTILHIRSLLKADDTKYILQMVKDKTLNPALRNRAASVVFGPRLEGLDDEFRQVVTELREFYVANNKHDHWQVMRGVAIALADQAGDVFCMADWISNIRLDPGLLEANLQMSDTYYGGVKNAVKRCMEKVEETARTAPAAQLWPVFYLGQRAVPRDQYVIGVLQNCIADAEMPDLRVLCEEAIHNIARDQP